MNFRRNVRGFSLIEMAIAMMVIGCFVATSLDLFRKFKYDIVKSETSASADVISSALGKYVAQNGRYPIPMAPMLKEGDTGYGDEATATMVTNADSCNASSSGLCRVDGLDDDVTNATPVADKVLVGSVPFKALGIPMRAGLDSFGRRLTYMVSEKLTVSTVDAQFKAAIWLRETTKTWNPFTSSYIMLNDTDPSAVPVLSDVEREPMAIISHGEDGAGAWTVNGSRFAPCGGGSEEQDENCDADGRLITPGKGDTGGGIVKVAGPLHNDDTISTKMWQDSNYWSVASSNEVFNKFLGYVGVNIDDLEQPGASLDVQGNIKAEQIFADRICTGVDAEGEPVDCFETRKIAGTGMDCRGGGVKGFANNGVSCANANMVTGLGLSANACRTGEYMVGISPMGGIICELPTP